MVLNSINGVIPPMITPFKENGDVDFDSFVYNIERWNRDAMSGYLVLGSNSESAYLTEEEKLKLIELTVQHARHDRMIIAGTGSESTRATIDLTNKAAQLGAQVALVLPPFYYHNKMTDEALITFFADVAAQSDIPILLYNVPKFTHINLSAHAIEILSRTPNIIGMKDSHGNISQLVSYQHNMDRNFNLIVGAASVWFPALTIGIKSGIFALANILPNECTRVQSLFENGDLAAAKEMYARLFPINEAITTTFGIAGLKYVADLMGYKGGDVRKPLLPLTVSEQEKIQTLLSSSQLV